MTELEKRQAEIIELQHKQIELQRQEIQLLREENALLREKIDYLLRQLYGAKSETFDPSQLNLFSDFDLEEAPDAADNDEDTTTDAPEADNIVPISKGKSRKNNRRSRLPENLSTTEETIIPDEVKAAPEDYRQIGQEISEKLNVEPPRYSIHRIIRPTYVSKINPQSAPVNAPLPPSLLEGSILTPSLLAHIITSKYNDHLPFYRQQQILERRSGIIITRATLANWAELAANTLQPIYNLIAEDILTSDFLNIDETPVKYLDRVNGGTSQGYFWVYRSEKNGIPKVLYDWQTSRAHTCLDNILINGGQIFKGILQCDGYNAYETWAAKQIDVILAGCWVHARRKFRDAEPHSKDATIILNSIAQIYHHEHEFKQWLEENKHPPEAIIYYRRRHHKKFLKNLRANLYKFQKKHLPKSLMGKAISYTLNQWHKLCLALKHSPTLDNNAAENAVRPLKLGAKNWLFIGGEDTGWRSAIIYTMIENCRLLGHDPFAYLKWVFEKIPSMTNQDDMRALLPINWIKNLKQHNSSEAVA